MRTLTLMYKVQSITESFRGPNFTARWWQVDLAWDPYLGQPAMVREGAEPKDVPFATTRIMFCTADKPDLQVEDVVTVEIRKA